MKPQQHRREWSIKSTNKELRVQTAIDREMRWIWTGCFEIKDDLVLRFFWVNIFLNFPDLYLYPLNYTYFFYHKTIRIRVCNTTSFFYDFCANSFNNEIDIIKYIIEISNLCHYSL